MPRAEVIRRLHLMVDQLETVPEDWFLEGIYPLHKVTFVDSTNDEAVTLIVGCEEPER